MMLDQAYFFIGFQATNKIGISKTWVWQKKILSLGREMHEIRSKSVRTPQY